jgi:hypothetical protein
MHRWRVGSVDVVRIEDDDFTLPSERTVPAWAIPEIAPSEHEVPAAFSAFAIGDADRRIVVDPWLANDAVRARADAVDHVERLLGELADAGFPAEAVDTVVDTHWDGIGWNTRPSAAHASGGWVPTFPNARYLYPAAEIAAWHAGAHPPDADGLAVLDARGVLDGVPTPGEAVALSDHVWLRDAPGHAAGHHAVWIGSDGATAAIVGHLFLNIFQIGDPREANDVDAATATATRRAMLAELAERDGLLLTTLIGGAGGGRVRRDGATYRLDPA